MKQVVTCIGSAGRDLFFPMDGVRVWNTPEDLTAQKNIVLELGAKYRTESRYESLGGCAANVSVALSRLGEASFIRCVVGSDLYGEKIRQELEQEGVNVSGVRRSTSSGTDVSCILVETKSSDRVIVYNRDANEQFVFSKKDVVEGGVVFMGGMYGNWQKNVAKIRALAEKSVIRLFYNPSQGNIKDDVNCVVRTIAASEVVFLNKDEAIEIVLRGCMDAKKERVLFEKYLAEKIGGLGARFVVITDGSRGAWAYNGKECYRAKSVPVAHVVDSTGAGDAFTGAFLAGYLRKSGMADCLRWGIVNGASAVQHYGAKEGMLTRGEIRTRARAVEVVVV